MSTWTRDFENGSHELKQTDGICCRSQHYDLNASKTQKFSLLYRNIDANQITTLLYFTTNDALHIIMGGRLLLYLDLSAQAHVPIFICSSELIASLLSCWSFSKRPCNGTTKFKLTGLGQSDRCLHHSHQCGSHGIVYKPNKLGLKSLADIKGKRERKSIR